MKVFISADIEGVTGVTHWDETDLNKAEFAAASEQMRAMSLRLKSIRAAFYLPIVK